jgi:hypothetical protein
MNFQEHFPELESQLQHAAADKRWRFVQTSENEALQSE